MPNHISYPEQNSGNGWKWAFFVLLLLAVAAVGWWLWNDRKDDTIAVATPTPTVTASPSPSFSPDSGVICTKEYVPVCGKDGKTYGNRCEAELQAKVVVAYTGACKGASPKPSPKPNTATPTPTPSVNQPEKNRQIEALLLQYTNEERAKNNLAPLKYHVTLYTLAKNHSDDMVKNNFFGHTSSTGKDPWTRASDAGTVIAAENIAKMGLGNVQGIGLVTNTPESVAQAQFKVWMGSSGHKQNILSSTVTELGIGTAFDGSFYLTTQIYR